MLQTLLIDEIANSYQKASLDGVDMRTMTEILESIKTLAYSNSQIFDILQKINFHIGTNSSYSVNLILDNVEF